MIFGQKMMFETRSHTKWGKKIIDILFNILFSLVIKQENFDVHLEEREGTLAEDLRVNERFSSLSLHKYDSHIFLF